MGVRLLNTLIKSVYNKYAIVDLKELKGKKIAIDTNIYIYKYSSYNNLMEYIYRLCLLLIKNDIVPIFIFDGETPEEKISELDKRKEKKKEAEEEYKILESKLDMITDIEELERILYKMKKLKKAYLRVKKKEVNKVKDLIRSFGLTVVEALDEGEKLCSYLSNKGIVDGIITEDSDIFVYGCNKVYRNISFINNTMIEYDYKDILEFLNLSKEDFINLCIISENDYNHNKKNIIENYRGWKLYKRKCDNILSYILDEVLLEDKEL
jgi:flap endonuclease-1